MRAEGEQDVFGVSDGVVFSCRTGRRKKNVRNGEMAQQINAVFHFSLIVFCLRPSFSVPLY